MNDPFELFGIPAAYDVDLAALERRYKELARETHPDRFAQAAAAARRAAMQRAVAVNDAWRLLRDPVRRAELLLRRAGIEIAGEGGAGGRAAPQGLLHEVMELREALMEARRAEAEDRIASLAVDVRRRRAAALARIAAGLRAGGDGNDAAAALVEVRYHDRFLDEIEDAAAARDDLAAGAGGGHA